MERLSCGCLLGIVEGETPGDSTLLFEPCDLECQTYLYLLAEAERQGTPLTTLDAR